MVCCANCRSSTRHRDTLVTKDGSENMFIVISCRILYYLHVFPVLEYYFDRYLSWSCGCRYCMPSSLMFWSLALPFAMSHLWWCCVFAMVMLATSAMLATVTIRLSLGSDQHLAWLPPNWSPIFDYNRRHRQCLSHSVYLPTSMYPIVLESNWPSRLSSSFRMWTTPM